MIKLNSLSENIFAPNAAEFGGNKERAFIVATGRMLMSDCNGRSNNTIHLLESAAADYAFHLDPTIYAKTNENLKQKLCLFGAKMAAAVTGATPPATYEDFLKSQSVWMNDSNFLRTLSGIMTEVVTPVLPATMSNAMSWLAQTVTVPQGKTYEIDVQSNDVFMFEDDSWGASQSKPSNNLYSYPITLNPRLRTAKVTAKWYQMVGTNADIGQFFNSINAGMYSKILALWSSALVAMSTNAQFIPSNLQFTTNNSPNWVKAIKRVSMSNRTSFRNVIAFGDYEALTKNLPTGIVNSSSVNLDAALSTMLGIEWAKFGYLGEYMGARLMPIENAIVPGTQNSTITEMIPSNRAWFVSTVGYKPIYVGFEEGTPITIELAPSQTADMSIDISVSISVAAVPVCASKISTMSPM